MLGWARGRRWCRELGQLDIILEEQNSGFIFKEETSSGEEGTVGSTSLGMLSSEKMSLFVPKTVSFPKTQILPSPFHQLCDTAYPLTTYGRPRGTKKQRDQELWVAITSTQIRKG